jgi:hypothetical protein
MPGEHYLELRDFVTGARLGIITGATGSDPDAQNGFLSLAVHRRVNTPGGLEVTLPGDHPVAATLADKTLITDWRRDRDRGIGWYPHMIGVFRDRTYASQDGRRRWTLTAPGLLEILSWYGVLWSSAVASRTAFVAAKAETIIKTLAQYNATASATAAAGRDRTAPLYGITIEADGARGSTIDWTASRAKTLLEEIQGLARVGGGDIDLVATSATTRELRFYPGQRGADKSALIMFAENLGSLRNVTWAQRRSQERTVALVAGAGEGAVRETALRTGPNYSAANDLELFVDARDVAQGAPAALQARGDTRLDEIRARDEFTFTVLQAGGVYYGPSGAGSYDLGDLVSVRRPDGP